MSGRPPFALFTPEGIEVKPLWTRADSEDLDFTDTIAGAFPFLRGRRATMYAAF